MKEERFKVSGDQIVSKVKSIIQEGNATRIRVLNEKEETIIEFPLTIGAVGTILAPVLAALGALAAIATNCTVVVEKKE